MIEKDDQQLMSDYANGDATAFKLLYARYEKPVYQFLYNGCHSDPLARELFQDIWMRVVKSHEQYNQHVPFKAWLFKTAKNRLIDSYRQQSTSALDQRSDSDLHTDLDNVQHEQFSASADSWSIISLNPEQITSLTQQSETLKSVLQTLPDAQREAVMLKHIAGMDIKEIAEIQGEGVQTVKSRLRYAMVKLRQKLKELSQ